MALNKSGSSETAGPTSTLPAGDIAARAFSGNIKQRTHEDGAKEGNRRNVAAVLAQGLTMVHGYTLEKALEAFDKIHAHLVEKDQE